MRFAKGHGTENDFIILPDPDGAIDLTPGLVARLCDRHAGLGADGVLRAVRVTAAPAAAPGAGPAVPGAGAGPAGPGAPAGPAVPGAPAGPAVPGAPAGPAVPGAPAGPAAPGAGAGPVPAPGDGAGWFMDYRNADGSAAEMCGNGIRVFARYLLDHDLAHGPELAVATRGGTRLLRAEPDGEITVDMGPPQVLGPGRATLAGRPLEGLRVSLGNPHLACLVDTPLAGFDLSQPPALDAEQFPDGVNLELVNVIDNGHILMRVHERGSGATRSCGTGAVAAVMAVAVAAAADGDAPAVPGSDGAPAAAVPGAGASSAPAAAAGAGRAPAGTWVVDVPGGRLRVTLDGRTSLLSGPAVIVAEGELDEAWLSGRPATLDQTPSAR